jgi:hypothetical protein
MNVCLSALILLALVPGQGQSREQAKSAVVSMPPSASFLTVSLEDKSANRIISGGGFLIDESGAVVTTCELIGKWLKDIDSSLVATAADGQEYTIDQVVSHNCGQNLVVAKISGKRFHAVKLNTTYRPKTGDPVVLIHSPRGTRVEVSRGSVKRIGGPYGSFEISVPQTSASAGSPVFNAKGEAIGVATVILTRGKRHHLVIPASVIERHLQHYYKAIKALRASLPPEAPGIAITPEKLARLDKALRAVSEKQGDAHTHIDLGRAYEDIGYYSEAARAFEQATKLAPDMIDGYAGLGLVYYRMGRYFDAAESYRQIVKFRPDYTAAYHKLGTIYILLGEYETALGAFQEVLRIDPANATARFHLAIAYYLQGNRVAAADEYAVLKDLDRERAAILHELLYE